MRTSCRAVAQYITIKYGYVVEIGIGHFPDVALALVDVGLKVLATDIEPFEYAGFQVIVDDICQPTLSLYSKADLIYALRPSPELVPYMERLAKAVSADLLVKPLASEWPPRGRLTGSGNAAFFLWGNL